MVTISLKRLCIILLVAQTLWISGPHLAHAAYAVFDSAAVSRLAAQFNQLKEQFKVLKESLDVAKDQLSVLNETRTLIDDQLKAVGEFGSVSIPYLELTQFATDLERARSCMIPDFSKILPDVEFDGQGLDLCDRNNGYKDHLWSAKSDLEGLEYEEINEIQDQVRIRRENMMTDATSQGLGLADKTIEDVRDLNDVAAEVERNAKSAQDRKTQLAVIGQGQAALLRAQAQTNQLLAQLLKVQATTALALGAPLSTDLTNEEDEESN